VLREHVRAGTPVVGMEPSCLATFKDELMKLMPHDEDARRLSQTAYHFAEFFTAFDIDPPRLPGDATALLWGHCHHKATGGTTPEQHILEAMGVEVDEVKGGCCGLAGSWGFEPDKYDISMACGEQALLPAVRDAGEDTFVVADGFSCKTQIADAGTGRRALHVAELMALAREGRTGPASALERRAAGRRPAPSPVHRVARTALGMGIAGGAVVLSSVLARKSLHVDN
jgi:Fe-S oxidoreductase